MLAERPPVIEPRIPPWKAPGPRRVLCDLLEAFYASVLAARLREGAAEDADLHQAFGPRQPGAPGTRTTARFEAVIAQALQTDARNFPLHMRQYALPALELIHHDQRRAITNCYLEGMPVQVFAQIARNRGVNARSVQSWLEQGKWNVISLLYDAHGHPVVPKELR